MSNHRKGKSVTTRDPSILELLNMFTAFQSRIEERLERLGNQVETLEARSRDASFTLPTHYFGNTSRVHHDSPTPISPMLFIESSITHQLPPQLLPKPQMLSTNASNHHHAFPRPQ